MERIEHIKAAMYYYIIYYKESFFYKNVAIIFYRVELFQIVLWEV